MARKRSTGSRSRLGPDLEGMLADFCEAHHVANGHEITKRALFDFIRRDLDANDGVRKEFDRLQKLRSQKPSLKIVAMRNPEKT